MYKQLIYNTPTTTDFYSVYYDVGPGFYPIIQTEDTIGEKRSEYCSYDPEFYVEIPDDRGCISRSNISSVHLADDIDPEIPEIKSVSIVNGKSVISWIPSAGAKCYAIYIQDSDGGWITIQIYGTNYSNENRIEVRGTHSTSTIVLDQISYFIDI